MIETSINTSYISDYLLKLKNCLDQACRCQDEKIAIATEARLKFDRRSAYFSKVKVYWEKIEATNTESTDVIAAIQVLDCVCDKVLYYVCCDLEAIELLIANIKTCSKQFEAHHCCLVELCQKIDMISNTSLKKDNPIITALKELKAKYEIAINDASDALIISLQALEELCFLKLKMTGDPDKEIPICNPEEDAEGESCSDLEVCLPDPIPILKDDCEPDCDCNTPTDPIEHQEQCEGLKESVSKIKELWLTTFPLNGKNPDDTAKCDYYLETKEMYQTSKCEMKCAKEELDIAEQQKNLAISRKVSVQNSYDAAMKANKC